MTWINNSGLRHRLWRDTDRRMIAGQENRWHRQAAEVAAESCV